MRSVWVSGEPPTFLTASEVEWKTRVRAALAEFYLPAGNGICLLFVVRNWRRRGQLFDLDNLAKPVLDALGRPVAPFVEVEVHLGESSGVKISTPAEPTQLVASTVWFQELPRSSIRRPDIHQALVGLPKMGRDGPLRVHLHVHEAGLITNFDFNGFVKPTIDRLWPLFGGTAHAPGDHRIKHLIITRSNEKQSGVSIGIESIG